MRKIIFIYCLILFSCANKSKQFDKNDYNKSRQAILSNEQNNPLNFLKIDGNKHKNLIGKTVTKSLLMNSASLCAYKNIRIKMLSYNKERNMIEEHEDVYANLLKPNSSAYFKTKYHLPKDVDSIALSIVSAIPVIDSAK